jgi:1,4-alpha-glucan branching enzyme
MVTSEAGRQVFRVFLPGARSVQVVGTFTGWRRSPIDMQRDADGWWSATLSLSPGDHDFSYLVDGCAWIADYAASGVKRNGFGGFVSQLHVHEPVVVPARQLAAVA